MDFSAAGVVSEYGNVHSTALKPAFFALVNLVMRSPYSLNSIDKFAAKRKTDIV